MPSVSTKKLMINQLAEYIRKTDKEPESVSGSEKEMEKLAQYFLGKHKQNPVDYTEKYRNRIAVPETKCDDTQMDAATSASTEQPGSVSLDQLVSSILNEQSSPMVDQTAATASDQPTSSAPVQSVSEND